MRETSDIECGLRMCLCVWDADRINVDQSIESCNWVVCRRLAIHYIILISVRQSSGADDTLHLREVKFNRQKNGEKKFKEKSVKVNRQLRRKNKKNEKKSSDFAVQKEKQTSDHMIIAGRKIKLTELNIWCACCATIWTQSERHAFIVGRIWL